MLYSSLGESWTREHKGIISVPKETTTRSHWHKGCLFVFLHTGFPSRGILSQQTGGSEGSLSTCTFTIPPENIPSNPSVFRIWIPSDHLPNAIHQCQKEYAQTVYSSVKLIFMTKRTKWGNNLFPVSRIVLALYFPPVSFPGIHSSSIEIGFNSALPPLAHTELCGRQVLERNS